MSVTYNYGTGRRKSAVARVFIKLGKGEIVVNDKPINSPSGDVALLPAGPGTGLAATAIYNLYIAHKPTTALPGLVISLISIAIMGALVIGKRKIGRALNSAPILADANCSMVCIYMSVVLLASSLIYQITGFGFADSLGALGLIYFSISEGRESFEKAAEIVLVCVTETISNFLHGLISEIEFPLGLDHDALGDKRR